MTRSASPLAGRMIFNVGARRSGTFWLQRVVTAHPEIGSVPSETYLFFGVAELFERLQHAARSSPLVAAAYVERDALLDSARDLCDTVFAPYLEPGHRYVAERTPLHVLKLDLIGDLYPDARIVHIIRDGRDSARSLAAQDFGPKQIEQAAAEWRQAIQAARAANLPPERYREIRYEDLLNDPEPTLAGLYEWLDLPTSPEILEAAVAEARAPANVDRFEIRRVGSGKWQDAFTPADLASFQRVAGDMLAELGYPEGSATRRPRRPNPLRSLRSGRGAEQDSEPERAGGGLLPVPTQRSIAHRQTISDHVLELVRLGDLESLRDRLEPNARVTLVSAAGRREARGPAGLELLAELLASDHALRAPQVIGDVIPGVPTTAYVLSHDLDGARQDRLVFVTVPGRLVTELAIYSLPLG